MEALPPQVVGYIHNYAIRNYWRVAAFYEIDDLFQDGLLCAVKCRERYGSDLDDPHFMALVKVTYSRHIIDLVRKCQKICDTQHIADLGDEVMVIEKHGGVEASLGELARMMNELPDFLYRTIKHLCNGGKPMRHLQADLQRYLFES